MSTVKMTEANFEETLKKNDIVILDFWAEWCGPCRAFGPVFEKISAKYPQIVFGKIDTEAEQSLAASFRIRSIPTLMAFRENILLFSQPGALPESALEELIQKIQALDMVDVKKQIAAQSNQTTQARA
jgi:thioredoxin 1